MSSLPPDLTTAPKPGVASVTAAFRTGGSKCLIQVPILGNKSLGKALKDGADILSVRSSDVFSLSDRGVGDSRSDGIVIVKTLESRVSRLTAEMFGAIFDPKTFDQHAIGEKQGFRLLFSLQSLHPTSKPRPGE